jgi:hypothetical protein
VGDLRDVICNRDAHNRIENRHQERDRAKHECRNEREYDFYVPYYDQPTRHRALNGGCNEGGIKALCRDLRRVRYPLNFKPPGIDKYDGSTNPVEWLKVY